MAKQLNVDMRFNADTSQAKKAIQDLQNSLSTIAKMPGNASNLFDDTEIKKASQAALELQGHLQKAVNVNTGKLDLSRFASSLKTSNKDLSMYANTLLNTGKQGQQAFLQLAQAIATSDTPVTRINSKLTEMGTVLKNTAKWQISSSVLHGFMGAIQSAYGYAQDLNESLNNIRIVTGQNIDQMAKFAETANRAAKALSTTTTDYTNASLIYYQQGLNDSQVQERTDITIKMANVARQSAEIVSDQMTAVWNNFDNGSKSLEYYADVMTALGAATASSTDEIAEGLEKFAAISSTVGLSYEYATAALATVTDKTRQSADVVGTAFKTMFARIQGLELGETLDDGTDLNKYSEALAAVGVSIKDSNGELRDMDNILNDMASVWETLNRDQQVALAQTVAGVRQYSQLMALMENWDAMEMNLGVVETSEGALQEQADIYAESWEAAQDRVRAAAEGIYQDLIDDEFFIDLLNGFEKALEGLNGFISGLGGMKGVISVVGSLFLSYYANKIPDALNNLKQNLMVVTGQANKSMQEMQVNLNKDLENAQATPGISESYKIQLQGIKEVNQMKQQLVLSSKHLTQAEYDNYEAKIQNVKAMHEELAELVKKKEALEQVEKATLKNAAATSKAGIEQLAKDFLAATNSVSRYAKKLEELDKKIANTESGSEKDNLLQTRQSLVNGLVEAQETADALDEKISIVKETFKSLEDVDISNLIIEGKMDDSVWISINKETQQIVKNYNSLVKQKAGLENLQTSVKGQANAWKKSGVAIKDYVKQTGDIKGVSQDIQEMKNQMSNYVNNIVKLAKEKGIVIHGNTINNLNDKINKMNANNIDKVIKKFDDFADTIKSKIKPEIEILDQEIDNISADMVKMQIDPTAISDVENITEQVGELGTKIENTNENISGFGAELPKSTFKMSTALTEFGSVTMSVSGLVTSIKGAISTMTDEGASGFEKFGAAISVIMPLMSTFNSISALSTTLSRKESVARAAQIVMEKLHIVTKKGETKAVIANNAAWLASPIFWIGAIIIGVVAALGLLVAGITAVTKALVDGYNADAIAAEKAAETAKELGDMYDQAASKYQQMIDTMSQYEEAQKSLNQLTKGTEEYTEALNNANRAALELIQNNPGKFTEGEDYDWEGDQLTFKPGVLDQAKAEAKDQESAAYAAKQYGQAKANGSQAKADQTSFTRQIKDDSGFGTGDMFWKSLINSLVAFGGGEAGANAAASGQQALLDQSASFDSAVNTVIEAYQNNQNVLSGDLAVFTSSMNALGIVDQKVIDALFENRDALQENAQASKNAVDSFKLASEAVVRELLGDKKDIQDSTNKDAVIDRSVDVQGKAYEAELAKLSEFGKEGTDQSQAWKDYAKEAGLEGTTFKGTSETEDGKILYEYLDANGQTLQVSLDAMKEMIATSKANTTTENVASNLVYVADFLDSAIADLNNKRDSDSALAAEGVKAAILGDFSGFTGEELSTLSTMDPVAYAQQMFGEDWEAQLIKIGFANAEEYMNSFSNGITAAQDIYNNALVSLGENSPLKDLAKGASADTVQSLANQATRAEGIGEGYGTDFQQNISDIVGTVGTENQGAALEALAGIDWSQLGASQEAIDALGKLNISSEETEEKINSLKGEMQELNGVNLNDLKTALDSDIDVEEYENLAKHIQDVADESEELSDDLKYNEKAAKKTSEAILRFNKVIQKVNDNYEDWSDTLESGSLQDQAKVVNEMKDAYADMLDIDAGSLSDDFIRNADNLELMKQAAEGSEDAYNQLQEAVRQDILAHCDLDTTDFDAAKLALDAELNELDFKNLEIGASLNSADALNEMTNLVNAANMTAQQATDYLASMGIDAEVETVTTSESVKKKVNDLEPEITYETGSGTILAPDGTGEQQVDVSVPRVTMKPVQREIEDTVAGGGTSLKVTSANKSSGGGFKYKHSNIGGGTGGGSKGGSSGGGGSKSSPSPAKKKTPTKKSDIIDRYKEISDALEDNTKALDKANKAADRLYGPAKIKALDQANKLLVEQNELLQQQYSEAENYLKQDKSDLQSAAGNLGISFSFDQDGDISNYTSVMETLYAQLADAEKTYNNLSTGEAQSDYQEKTLDPLREKIDKIKELVEQYDETKTLLEDIGTQIEDNQAQIDSNHTQMITYVVEVKTEAAEAELEYLDYLIEKLENSGYNAAKAISYMGDQVEQLGKIAEAAQEGIDRLYQKNEGKEITDWSAEDLESLKQYRDQLLDVNQQLMDTRQAVEDTLMQAFDDWREGYQEQIEKFDHYDQVYESYANITDLLGKSSGATKQEKQRYNQARADNATRKLASSKTYYDEVTEKVGKGQAELDAAKERMKNAEKGSDEYNAAKKDIETWKKYLKAAKDEQVTAEQDYLANWEAALQAAQDAFIANAQLELQAFEEQMAGVYGSFEAMQETFDRNSEASERYLQDYEKLYELNKLNRNLENEIDNTSNIKAKEKLLKIQEKINQYQAEGVEMSQYDLEYLQKEYELELAKIAMEEAKNAKSQVRMTRDSEGNYSYTYTADEEQADNAAQSYEDKLHEITELSNKYVREQSSAILSAQQELQNKLNELVEQSVQEGWSEEQLKAKAAETEAYYNSLLSYYGSEIDKASLNNTVIHAREYETYAGYVGDTITEAQKLEAEQKALIVEAEANVERLRIQQQAANDYLTYLYESDQLSAEEYMKRKAETNAVYVDQITIKAIEGEQITKDALQVMYDNELLTKNKYNQLFLEATVASNANIALANIEARDEELAAVKAAYKDGVLNEKEYKKAKKEINKEYNDDIKAATEAAKTAEQNYLKDQYEAGKISEQDYVDGLAGIETAYNEDLKTTLENRTSTSVTEAEKQQAAQEGVAESLNTMLPGLEDDYKTASDYAKDMSKAIQDAIGKSGVKKGTGILGAYSDFKKDTEDTMRAAGTSTKDFAKDMKKYLVGEDGKGGVNKRSKDTKTSIEKMAKSTDKLDESIIAVSKWQKTYGIEAEKVIRKNEKTIISINKVLQTIAKLSNKEYLLTYTYKTVGSEPKGKNQSYTITYEYQTTGNNPKKSQLATEAAAIVQGVHNGSIKQTSSGWRSSAKAMGYSDEAISLALKAFNDSKAGQGYDYYYEKALELANSYDTGGYTGAWGPDGKLAILHQKELVLNASDTENMLLAISTIRDIVKMIDLQAYQSQIAQLASYNTQSNYNSTKENIEQHIEIHAEFPDATNHNEIEEAFNNLLNLASQQANRRY